MAHGRPERLKTFDYLGCHRYFLTFCVKGREQIFRTPIRVNLVRTQILRTAERYGFALLAYTFMPDHLHLLVEGRRADADLRRFAAAARRMSSNACRGLAPGGIWQDGYFERTLRPGEDAGACIDYILANPVKAGLVGRPSRPRRGLSVCVGDRKGTGPHVGRPCSYVGRPCSPWAALFPRYCPRIAFSGLILAARRAGIQQAVTPTSAINAETPMTVNGSFGAMPNSSS